MATGQQEGGVKGVKGDRSERSERGQVNFSKGKGTGSLQDGRVLHSGNATSATHKSCAKEREDRLSTVHFAIFGDWLTDPVFHWKGFSVTAAGVFALGACVVIGFSLAGFLQSKLISRLLGRIGLDKKFFAIVRFVLSLFFVVGFIVLGLNFAGLAVPWEQQIPGLNLSLAQILRLIFAVFLVFWLSSVIKGQMVSRVLSRSGLDASIQYAIAQIIGYVVITIGFFLALQNTGINLSALTVFAGAVGVGVGLGLQKHLQQLH